MPGTKAKKPQSVSSLNLDTPERSSRKPHSVSSLNLDTPQSPRKPHSVSSLNLDTPPSSPHVPGGAGPTGRRFAMNLNQKHKAYYYLGHGTELCLRSKPLVKYVPAGSAYLTTTECGFETQSNLNYEARLIRDLFSLDIDRVLRREKQTRTQLLFVRTQAEHGYFNDAEPTEPRRFHLHPAGADFVENTFTAADGDSNAQDIVHKSGMIHLSGVYSLSSLETIMGQFLLRNPRYKSPKPEEDMIQDDGPFHKTVRAHDTLKDCIMFMYAKASWPNVSDVMRICKAFAASKGTTLNAKADWKLLADMIGYIHVHDTVKANISDLMTMLPGLHIYDVCRYTDGACREEEVVKRRKHSKQYSFEPV